MSSAGRTAAEQALIAAELEALRFHWGDAYEIEFIDGQGWRARRLDGQAGWLKSDNREGMYATIGADYLLRPVPRSFTPGG